MDTDIRGLQRIVNYFKYKETITAVVSIATAIHPGMQAFGAEKGSKQLLLQLGI